VAAAAPAASVDRSALDRFFKVTETGSTVMTEIRGGATNFLVMSYILVVNAVILANAGMPRSSPPGWASGQSTRMPARPALASTPSSPSVW